MKRVLIVEDERLLALMVEDLLLDAGYDVEHAFDLSSAEAIILAGNIDAAILDIRIGETTIYRFARKLGSLGIPYLFASSAHRSEIPKDLRWQPLIAKPYLGEQVVTSIRAVCGDLDPRRQRWRQAARSSPRRTGEHPVV